jgi:hypothetical protein
VQRGRFHAPHACFARAGRDVRVLRRGLRPRPKRRRRKAPARHRERDPRFPFSRSDKLTWYFDHHVSAFPTPEDRATFEAKKSGGQFFHDGTYPSCTKYIRDIGKSVFDVDFSALDELVRWADIIDSANFPSAETAVARKEPPLQLMTVIEHMGDDAMLVKMVHRLSTESLDSSRALDVQSVRAARGRTSSSSSSCARTRR